MQLNGNCILAGVFSRALEEDKPRNIKANLAELEVLANGGQRDTVLCHTVLHKPVRWSLQISENTINPVS